MGALVIGAVWSFVVTLFRYPDGIVLGNLLASAIWAAPAITHLHRQASRHHAERMTLLREIHAHTRQHNTAEGIADP
jgi:hypothetical protein